MKHHLVPALIAATSITTTVRAETITVCDSGCSYTSIVAAINGAIDGDVIQLSAQTYTESETINLQGKAITIRGTTDADHPNGAPTSVLVGGMFHGVMRCENGEGTSTVLENLQLEGGHAGYGGGLYLRNSSPSIVNCTFRNNHASIDGGGLYLDNSSPTMNSCRIEANSSSGNGGGIFCNTFSSPTLSNCIIGKNTASGQGGGMFDDTGSHPTLNGCTVTANTPIGSCTTAARASTAPPRTYR